MTRAQEAAIVRGFARALLIAFALTLSAFIAALGAGLIVRIVSLGWSLAWVGR